MVSHLNQNGIKPTAFLRILKEMIGNPSHELIPGP